LSFFLLVFGSSISLGNLSDLRFDLREDRGGILLVVRLDLLLGEFSHFSSHHALLVLEKAVRTAKEAVESDHFLQETQLGVGRLLGLGLLGALDGFLEL